MENNGPSGIKTAIRKEKLGRRRRMENAEVSLLSRKICERIIASGEYKSAENLLIYNHINNEVDLTLLAEHARGAGKKLAYPLCFSHGEMKAFEPMSDDAFINGAFGIREPDEKRSRLIEPEEIDLVICPLTAFDERCGRIGMGGGYYDRYLPKCVNAFISAAAYEFQKTDRASFEDTDISVDAVFTESAEYRQR